MRTKRVAVTPFVVPLQDGPYMTQRFPNDFPKLQDAIMAKKVITKWGKRLPNDWELQHAIMGHAMTSRSGSTGRGTSSGNRTFLSSVRSMSSNNGHVSNDPWNDSGMSRESYQAMQRKQRAREAAREKTRLVKLRTEFSKLLEPTTVIVPRKPRRPHPLSTPLFSQYARQPYKRILVDPATGHILKSAFRARFDPQFLHGNGHGRHRDEFRTKQK